MTPSYCLDTNVLLLLLRGKEAGIAIEAAFGLMASPYLHTLSIVTHGEILALVDRSKWGAAKLSALNKALEEFVTIDIAGRRIVEAYRQIETFNAAFKGGAVKMGKNDIWIAASAIVSGLDLITTDRDFRHLDGVLLKVHRLDPNSAAKF